MEYNLELEGEQTRDQIIYQIWSEGRLRTMTIDPEEPLDSYYYWGINFTKDWESSSTGNTIDWCVDHMNSFENCRVRDARLLRV